MPWGSSSVSPKTGRREWPAVRNSASTSLSGVSAGTAMMSARGTITSATRTSCSAEHVLQDRALLRREVGVRVGAFERVLDVVAHRARAQAEQPAQPLEQALACRATARSARALDSFGHRSSSGVREFALAR